MVGTELDNRNNTSQIRQWEGGCVIHVFNSHFPNPKHAIHILRGSEKQIGPVDSMEL
jgi:hypothetical protein